MSSTSLIIGPRVSKTDHTDLFYPTTHVMSALAFAIRTGNTTKAVTAAAILVRDGHSMHVLRHVLAGSAVRDIGFGYIFTSSYVDEMIHQAESILLSKKKHTDDEDESLTLLAPLVLNTVASMSRMTGDRSVAECDALVSRLALPTQYGVPSKEEGPTGLESFIGLVRPLVTSVMADEKDSHHRLMVWAYWMFSTVENTEMGTTKPSKLGDLDDDKTEVDGRAFYIRQLWKTLRDVAVEQPSTKLIPATSAMIKVLYRVGRNNARYTDVIRRRVWLMAVMLFLSPVRKHLDDGFTVPPTVNGPPVPLSVDDEKLIQTVIRNVVMGEIPDSITAPRPLAIKPEDLVESDLFPFSSVDEKQHNDHYFELLDVMYSKNPGHYRLLMDASPDQSVTYARYSHGPVSSTPAVTSTLEPGKQQLALSQQCGFVTTAPPPKKKKPMATLTEAQRVQARLTQLQPKQRTSVEEAEFQLLIARDRRVSQWRVIPLPPPPPTTPATGSTRISLCPLVPVSWAGKEWTDVLYPALLKAWPDVMPNGQRKRSTGKSAVNGAAGSASSATEDDDASDEYDSDTANDTFRTRKESHKRKKEEDTEDRQTPSHKRLRLMQAVGDIVNSDQTALEVFTDFKVVFTEHSKPLKRMLKEVQTHKPKDTSVSALLTLFSGEEKKKQKKKTVSPPPPPPPQPVTPAAAAAAASAFSSSSSPQKKKQVSTPPLAPVPVFAVVSTALDQL